MKPSLSRNLLPIGLGLLWLWLVGQLITGMGAGQDGAKFMRRVDLGRKTDRMPAGRQRGQRQRYVETAHLGGIAADLSGGQAASGHPLRTGPVEVQFARQCGVVITSEQDFDTAPRKPQEGGRHDPGQGRMGWNKPLSLGADQFNREAEHGDD